MRRTERLFFKIVVLGLLLDAVWLPENMHAAAPLWGFLLFTFWSLYYPGRNEMFHALFFGLAIDVLHGDILGQNALALIAASAALANVKKSFGMINTTTRQVYIFLGGCVYLAILLGVQALVHGFGGSGWIFLSPLTGAIIWPLVEFLLGKFKH